ncbi:hypothetical protein V8E36_009298, partial [Tilletia maclaganii]
MTHEGRRRGYRIRQSLRVVGTLLSCCVSCYVYAVSLRIESRRRAGCECRKCQRKAVTAEELLGGSAIVGEHGRVRLLDVVAAVASRQFGVPKANLVFVHDVVDVILCGLGGLLVSLAAVLCVLDPLAQALVRLAPELLVPFPIRALAAVPIARSALYACRRSPESC